MAIDIIGHLNTEITSLTPQQKQKMLNDLCNAHGYTPLIINEFGDTVDNPESKKAFANRMIIEQIKKWVNVLRRKEAEKLITIQKLDIV